MTEFMQTASAVLALVAVAGAALLIISQFVGTAVPAMASVRNVVFRYRTAFTAALAGWATFGSLYFSEVAKYVPCRLCWFQRIAMYPIAVVAIVALITKARHPRRYVLPLAIVGACISGYHWLIELGVIGETGACSASGPACSLVWFTTFKFMTLAVMAFFGFVTIIVVNLITPTVAKSPKEQVNA